MVQNYVMAKDAKEALNLLAGYEGRGRIIAGGTDLVLDLQSGKYQAECLVDITGIPGLAEMKLCGGALEVGAAVTHNQAAESPLIRRYAHALAKASHSVGSNQIRNCSTIGGNIVNGQPAADSAVALAALGASVEVMYEDGAELLSMDRLYAGFGKSTVDSTKSLVTRILIPEAGPGEGSGYARLEQRKALALPMVCVAAFLGIRDGMVERCRIAMAPLTQRVLSFVYNKAFHILRRISEQYSHLVRELLFFLHISDISAAKLGQYPLQVQIPIAQTMHQYPHLLLL